MCRRFLRFVNWQTAPGRYTLTGQRQCRLPMYKGPADRRGGKQSRPASPERRFFSHRIRDIVTRHGPRRAGRQGRIGNQDAMNRNHDWRRVLSRLIFFSSTPGRFCGPSPFPVLAAYCRWAPGRAVRRYSPGVMPMRRLNVIEKCDAEWNPSRSAMSWIGAVPTCSW